MNIIEAKEKVRDHGIYQLNQGESLADALDHIENGTPRKGYKVKADNGRRLTRNEIVMNANTESFMKFTPKEFVSDEVESIDDITDDIDFRDDKTQRGVIISCYYCGGSIRIDAQYDGMEDYEEPQDMIHCDGCMRDAIARLAM